MMRPVLLMLLGLLAAGFAGGADRLKFPAAAKRPVVDTYFGTTVRDNYRWLETEDDPAVLAFATKQQARTRRWLDALPQRAALHRQLSQWSEQATSSHARLVDTPAGLFALTAAPGKQQRFIVRLGSVDDPAGAVTIVDPNTLDPSGATSIDWWQPSPSGRLLAVCLSEHGSEAGTLHFFDATTGVARPDRIPRVQFPTGGGSVAWNEEESAVLYTRYPAPGERPETDARFHQQVFEHRLGTEVAQDVYSIGRDFPRIAEIELTTSPDGAFTLARVSNGDGGDHAFFVRPPSREWFSVAGFDEGVKEAEIADDGMLYLLTRHEAPRGRVLRISAEHPDLDSAVEVVAQGEGVIREIAVHDGRLYVSELAGGPSRLQQFSTDGSSRRAVPLPPWCSIGGLEPRQDGTLLVRLGRYVEPPAWHVFNPTTSTLRRTALVEKSPVTFDDVRVEQSSAVAADGTSIPITLLVPARVAGGTPAPLLLQAYGSYGAPNEPYFQAERRLWFDAGGVIAIAHVRGGGDFGEAWHKAGNLTKKQTTISDFLSCAQHLVAQHWTSREQLAILGTSAGGLLMGAALTQAPDLFRAVVARVGIHDMLRVESTPNGQYNITEFGTVTNREQFEALHAYSPYHRVEDRRAYPAVLLTTGLHDGRVAPAQSFKMAARLQTATSSRHPVLLRVDVGSGHGLGTPRSTRVEESADIYAFLFAELGLVLPSR